VIGIVDGAIELPVEIGVLDRRDRRAVLFVSEPLSPSMVGSIAETAARFAAVAVRRNPRVIADHAFVMAARLSSPAFWCDIYGRLQAWRIYDFFGCFNTVLLT